MLGGLVLAMLMALAAAQAKSPEGDYKLVVDVNLVSVLATVTTADGAWVSGLQQSDFQILENGRLQEIKVFGKESDLPLQLCLLFDSSVSIATELRTQQEAAIQFLSSILRPLDRVSVLQVSDEVDQLIRSSNRLERVSQAVRSIKPGGGTSLYDAVYLAAEILSNAQGRRVIVVISDGTDTTSRLQLKDCLRKAQNSEAVVYALVVQPIKSEPGRNLGGEHAMIYLAEKTGGRFFKVASPDSVRVSFDRISEELRTQYYLGYYPQPPAVPDGGFRRIEVRTSQPFHIVRAREGYYPSQIP